MQKEPIARISEYDNILIMGGGGGYDVWLGLPIFRHLKSLGKKVILANYSFADDIDQYPLVRFNNTQTKYIHEIDEKSERTQKNRTYFPEHDLSIHVGQPVFAIRQVTPDVLWQDLEKLVKKFSVSVIVSIDAGFDGIMYGNEKTSELTYYGSPLEDMCTIVALAKLHNKLKIPVWWVCGSVPTEGIPIQHFYRNLADQIKHDGFLGCTFPILSEEMKADYLSLLNKAEILRRSIPNESFYAALNGACNTGHFINSRLTARFENESDTKTADIADYPPVYPPTGIYWFFDVSVLKERSPLINYLYVKAINEDCLRSLDDVNKMIEFHTMIRWIFRNSIINNE
jgi:hypothetical protein